jgi:hypothetical protein
VRKSERFSGRLLNASYHIENQRPIDVLRPPGTHPHAPFVSRKVLNPTGLPPLLFGRQVGPTHAAVLAFREDVARKPGEMVVRHKRAGAPHWVADLENPSSDPRLRLGEVFEQSLRRGSRKSVPPARVPNRLDQRLIFRFSAKRRI